MQIQTLHHMLVDTNSAHVGSNITLEERKPHKKNNNLYRVKNEKGRKEGSYTPSTHKQKIQWK